MASEQDWRDHARELNAALLRARDERDEWRARAEAAEAELTAVREDGPPAWQRKPITHEWAYGPATFGRLNAMLAATDSQRPGFGLFATWWIGEPHPCAGPLEGGRSTHYRAPLCRPIEPAKGSERGDA